MGHRGAYGVGQAWVRLFRPECRVLRFWLVMQCWNPQRLAEVYPIRSQTLYGECSDGVRSCSACEGAFFCVHGLWRLQICCSEAMETGSSCYRPIPGGV